MNKFLTMGMIGSVALAASMNVFANHSVFVEGESDFDGDGSVVNGAQAGMVGALTEDTDGDQVFATFAAAIANINNNGSVTCVTSGRFGEGINLDVDNNTLANTTGGNIIIQAAPGVDCNIEAFFGGAGNAGRSANFSADNAAANTGRQAAPGITIDTPVDRQVIIRNLVIENWADCVTVSGTSRVVLDNVRCNNNIGVGVRVADTANVELVNSSILSAGFRQTGGGTNFPSGTGATDDPNFDGRGVVCTGTSTCRLTTSQVKASCNDGVTQGASAVVVVRGSSVTDSGNVTGVCTGVDFATGFDFSNFLPN